MWNFVYWYPRYISTIINRFIALLQLLYEWKHQFGFHFHMNASQYKSLCKKWRDFICEFSIEVREVLKKSSYALIWNQFALKINSPPRPIASGRKFSRNHLDCAAHTNVNTRPGSATGAQDVLKLCGPIHCKWSPEHCVRRGHSLAPQIACIFMARSAVSQTMDSEDSSY